MQSFEHVCKVSLESENFIVTSNVKFPVRRKTRRKDREQYQTNGFEVDLVGARGDRLVLAEVKSFFGSGGVGLDCFKGLADKQKTVNYFSQYKIFNDARLRKAVLKLAAERYGYEIEQIEMRLYVGKFRSTSRPKIEKHLAKIGVRVVALDAIAKRLLEVAESKTYTDDPVVMTVKSLMYADWIKERTADDVPFLDEGEQE